MNDELHSRDAASRESAGSVIPRTISSSKHDAARPSEPAARKDSTRAQARSRPTSLVRRQAAVCASAGRTLRSAQAAWRKPPTGVQRSPDSRQASSRSGGETAVAVHPLQFPKPYADQASSLASWTVVAKTALGSGFRGGAGTSAARRASGSCPPGASRVILPPRGA